MVYHTLNGAVYKDLVDFVVAFVDGSFVVRYLNLRSQGQTSRLDGQSSAHAC
jgi:hypothetical protein